MARTQKFGIKFPIKVESDRRTLVDLNLSKTQKIKSELMHLIFTPKGQMLREPEFGSGLIQYIFSPNDSQTWGDIKFDIQEMVSRYIKDCQLTDIEVYEENQGLKLVVKLKFNVVEDDGSITENEMVTTI